MKTYGRGRGGGGGFEGKALYFRGAWGVAGLFFFFFFFFFQFSGQLAFVKMYTCREITFGLNSQGILFRLDHGRPNIR